MTGPEAPFFSVVVAVYNGQNYVAGAIDSVLRQTFGDWELVIVDDASTDGTPPVLAEFSRGDARVRVFRNDLNVHAGAAANRGIREARGVWIARLDADDRFHPEHLERVRAEIGDSTGDFFVSSWVRVVGGDGETILDLRLPDGETVRRMMPEENFLYHSATAFPKALWEKAGGYPEERFKGIDAELWRRFFRAGAEIRMIPEVLVDYRIHAVNLTTHRGQKITEFHSHEAERRRANTEWVVSLMLKQEMLTEARRLLLGLAKSGSRWSLKNAFYFVLTFAGRPAARFFMWKIRPRLRKTGKPSS